MADDLDELRSRIRLVDLVGQSVSLKRTGKNWTGLCPFHDDKRPSFTVSDETGRYRCWSCGEKGDIFTWVMKTQHIEFGDALRFLAQSIGYDLKGAKSEDKGLRERMHQANRIALEFFRNEFERSPVAKQYCEHRGLDRQVIEEWELGYAPEVDGALGTLLKKAGIKLSEAKDLFLVDQDPSGGYFDKFRGRLMFPIRSETGQLVAFGGRILGEGHPKYINSSDTMLFRKSRTLYGLNRAKDHLVKDAPAVLCEGYLDVIACHRAGVQTAVASLGTSLTEDHAKLLKRWTSHVTILYDADAAGEKASERAAHILNSAGLTVQVAIMPKGEDPDTLLAKSGPAGVQSIVEAPLSTALYEASRLAEKIGLDKPEAWIELASLMNREPAHAPEVMNWASTRHPTYDPQETLKYLQQLRRAYDTGAADTKSPAVNEDVLLESLRVQLLRGRERLRDRWRDIQTILQKVRNPDLAEQMVREASARHPFIADRRRAYADLAGRTPALQGLAKHRAHQAAKSRSAHDLSPDEVLVFLAILDPSFRPLVWPALEESGLLPSSGGRDIAAHLVDRLGEQPVGPPSDWLARLDEEIADRLSDLSMRENQPLTAEFVTETLAHLRRGAVARQLVEARNVGDLGEIQERLKQRDEARTNVRQGPPQKPS